MYEEYLIHYGVKGMKWGIRKKSTEPQNKRYDVNQRKNDKDIFGKRGVRRINRRMNKGKTHKQAERAEWIGQIAKGVTAISAISVGMLVATNPMGAAKIAARTINKGANAVNSVLQKAKDAKYYKYTDIGTVTENGEFIAKILLK